MPQTPAQPRPTHPHLEWYLNAHFGLFIHWGAYSVGGVEASWPIMTPDLAEVMFKNPRRIREADYTQLPGRFNPAQFDAKTWVRMAQDAGMRYIVITSKHHDGFCMFDAPGTDYKITRAPYGWIFACNWRRPAPRLACGWDFTTPRRICTTPATATLANR